MKLIKSFSIYTISQVLNKGIGLLLLPVFTTYLSTSEFGLISLYSTAVSVLTILVMMGTDSSIRRQYYNLEGRSFNDFFTTVILFPIASAIPMMGICIFMVNQFSIWLGVSGFWIYLLPVVTVTAVYAQIQTGIFRVQEQALAFGLFNLGQLVVNILLGIWLIIYSGMGYEGRLLGMLAANVVFAVLSFCLFYKNGYLSGSPSQMHMSYSLKYGLPLIPHQIGGMVINFSDRFFIAEMVGKSELGIYSVAYTFGSMVLFFLDAFNNSFVPFLFKNLKEDTDRAKIEIVKVSYIFTLALFTFLMMLTFLAPFTYKYFIGKEFQSGAYLVFWVGLGYFFLGIYKMFCSYIFFYEKTIYLTAISAINVIVNLVLNYFFIRKFGVIGAAYATVLTCFVFMLITIVISVRLKSMPWLFFLRNEN